jgi:CarboxypepD_reg-like domain/Secretion system C-terminal sorting domain
MKKGLFTLTLLCSIIVALSAQKTVTGTVLDEKGEPMPQVVITIKGTNENTVADIDGLFAIKVNNNNILVFSFIGFEKQEINSNGLDTLTVTLKESIVKEVIVFTERVRYCCRCYFKPQIIEGKMCQIIQPKLIESMLFDKQKNREDLINLLKNNPTEFNKKDENTEGVEPKERILVYSEKISVEGSNYLKINTLFNESNQIALSISSPQNEVANFRIVDMAGRVLTSHQQSLLKENNTLTLAHNDLPAGMYILHVQQSEQTDSRKFSITK